MTDAPVGIVLPSLSGGGAERKLLDLAGELSNRGRTVDLVLLTVRGEYRDLVPQACTVFGCARKRTSKRLVRFFREHHRYHGLPAHKFMSLLNWRRYRQLWPATHRKYCTFGLVKDAEIVRRYILARGPRSLLSGLPRANWATVLGREIDCSGRKPLVVASVHNNYNHDRRAIGSQANRIRSLMLYPHANTVVGVSHGVAKCAADVLKLDSNRVCSIYNGFPIASIIEQSRCKIETGWELFHDSIPVILNTSRLVAKDGQKDFETLISAFALVRKTTIAKLVCLSVTSDQDARLHELVELATQLGVQSDVSFLKFSENPFPYMRAAAVLVLSSRWEGFPSVLVEAMACGTPVVSTNCPFGPSEALAEGRYGALVSVGDADGMADAIQAVLQGIHPSPATLRTRAEEFSIERATDEYEKLLFG